MRRFLSVIFMCLVMIGFAGCGSNKSTPAGIADTPLPNVATLVAQTVAALNTFTPAESQSEISTSTPTLPMPTGTSTPTATPQENLPTETATSTAMVPPVEATQTPEASSTPETSPTPTVELQTTNASTADDCIDKAGFFGDATVPDYTLLPVNTEFTKTWRFRNEGTCTWGDGYEVVFANGHNLNGPPSTPLPHAAPGEIVSVSVNLKTPSVGGTYFGDWQFQNPAGKRFGVNSHGEDMFWVKIKVDWGPGIGPTATPPPVDCAYERNADYEAQVLQLINSARTANGLPALNLQNQLSAAAQGHSADMACHSSLDHTGSDKSTHSSRLKAQGYKYSHESENIFAGGNAQDAFDWWMNSPIHRANILSKKVTQIGIGYAYFGSSQFGGYYTLDFAHP